MMSFTDSPRRDACIAGLLYLVIIVCGVGGQGLVREPLLAESAARTVANLLEVEAAFRWSMLADGAMVLADVGVGVLLFQLFAPVSRTLSLMAMAFRLAQAAVLGANLVNLHQAVSLASMSGIDVATRDAMVVGYLDAHAAGYDFGLLFFAVNCLVTGVLVVRSGFVPRAIGVGIGLSGAVYLVGSVLRFVAPALAPLFAPAFVVPLIAELAFCAFLLTRGVSVARGPVRSRVAA